MAQSDEEGFAEVVFNSVLHAWNVIELCLTQWILHRSYYMSESAKTSNCLQVLGPHPLVPGKTKSTSLVYFFELNKPVLFWKALVGCTKSDQKE